MKVLAIALALLLPLSLGVACEEAEPLVTLECTDATATSLTAQGRVNRLDDGSLSIRGFVIHEAIGGEPDVSLVSLENPSFEQDDPLGGWTGWRSSSLREATTVRTGSYSVRVEIGDGYAIGNLVQDLPDHEDYRGVTVRVGAWAKPGTGGDVRVGLTDGKQWVSAVHSRTEGWEWLSEEMTVASDATRLAIELQVREKNDVRFGYFDGVILTVGGQSTVIVEDGEFGTGAYSLDVTGLRPDTLYRVRAFVADITGIRYGNTVTCTTLP